MHASRMNNDLKLICCWCCCEYSWFINYFNYNDDEFWHQAVLFRSYCFFLSQKSLNERWKLKHTHSLKGWKILKIVALNFNIILSHFFLKDIVLASCRHQLFAATTFKYVHICGDKNKWYEERGVEWHVPTLYRQWYHIPFPYC